MWLRLEPSRGRQITRSAPRTPPTLASREDFQTTNDGLGQRNLMEIPAILLLHEEYGKYKEGVSSTHRQLVLTLREHLPNIPLFSTVLKATVKDKQDAHDDGVELLLPKRNPNDSRDPSLAWITFDHLVRYPHLPSKVRSIVGYFDITSKAAVNIKQNRFPDAKVILFSHDIPEDTESYKGAEKAMCIGAKKKSILEDAKEADVVFSLGKKIFDYFQNEFRALSEEKPPHHVKFVPRPSKIFEDARPVYTEAETMVVLSIGRVTSLVVESLSIVAERMNIKWWARVVNNEDDFKESKEILDHSKSTHLQVTLYRCDSQEDICQHMMQAHLVLMPSHAEPFGLIGLEAIAAGVPVLVSSKSGLADFIKEHIKELRHSIVDMVESKEFAKHLAKSIEDILKNNETEFENAARCKKKLLSTEYWKESHHQFIKACEDEGNGTQQPAQEKRKRSASPVEYDEGSKASKQEDPPIWPIKVEILEQVKPSIKTPEQMLDFAIAGESLQTEITMTDKTHALLQQLSAKRIVVKATINVEDFKKAMVYILTTPAAKGLHHTTSVDNVNTLSSPTSHVDHSSLRGLDLAMFSREEQTHKDQQVQTALRHVRISEQQASRLKLQTARENSAALILSLNDDPNVRGHKEDYRNQNEELTAEYTKLSNRLKLTHDELQEEKEKAQKVLLEHKETIQVLEDTNKTKETRNEELTAENIKLTNQLRDSDKLQNEVRTLRQKNEALQELLLEKSQEIQQSQEMIQGKGARSKSLFDRMRDRFKQRTEGQNQGDDSTRPGTGGTEESSLCSSSHEVDGVSRKVTVVDTPGVSQEMTESEFEELVRAVKMVPEEFDAICLVWDYDNSDRNEEKRSKCSSPSTDCLVMDCTSILSSWSHMLSRKTSQSFLKTCLKP
ncbi:hypothetical protein Bbelb_319210 [Branchiostoma belcheri]|nr:hypothetical protein Bbelb_319210 [Branchiostoma belcheri]